MPEDKTGVTVPLTGGEPGTCVGVVGLCYVAPSTGSVVGSKTPLHHPGTKGDNNTK